MENIDAIDVTGHTPMPVRHFSVPKHYETDLESVLIPNGMIRDRIDRLARNILEECTPHSEITLLCVLKGAYLFFSEMISVLMRLNVDRPNPVRIHVEFVRLSSYANDVSTGHVRILGLNLAGLYGKHLLIIEDIVDTGRSAIALLEELRRTEPASVRFASLLLKKSPHWNGFRPDYVGFIIPDAFLVGYALDYNEHFRDLDHLCILNDEAKAKYQVSLTSNPMAALLMSGQAAAVAGVPSSSVSAHGLSIGGGMAGSGVGGGATLAHLATASAAFARASPTPGGVTTVQGVHRTLLSHAAAAIKPVGLATLPVSVTRSPSPITTSPMATPAADAPGGGVSPGSRMTPGTETAPGGGGGTTTATVEDTEMSMNESTASALLLLPSSMPAVSSPATGTENRVTAPTTFTGPTLLGPSVASSASRSGTPGGGPGA
ncbi:hypothetical protein H696_00447 [Fonticula alba]|uniref:hypoxanthine phosphoribosyltransferase n=1 Tax=Fonticula alba TaxID=691883 RepID=A0A058ZFZ7_FONAL|nr:hypothetical protein H696_00447 [Fonticula alba]KCV72876.1 hypothetical protein H696_00447 [Fonticula alba]|eukprot:XP_009492577.1 hypothetical protein H696_00447 [Fonticula alba]